LADIYEAAHILFAANKADPSRYAQAKAEAEAEAHKAMTAADARISETRIAAKEHVVRAAAEAAIAIVARLTGETVTAGDAARAVEEA